MRPQSWIWTFAILSLLAGIPASADSETSSQDRTDGLRGAVSTYLREIEEIDRAAARQKAEARARLEQALGGSEPAKPAGPKYKGMLGSYFNAQGRIPFVFLGVPDGENVFSEQVRSVFNGRYDASRPLVRFRAEGHVAIPRDDVYVLEASPGHEDVKIDGKGYFVGTPAPAGRYRAEVRLTKGVHDILFSIGNNGGQLPGAAFRILEKESGQELPPFFQESELTSFLADTSLGAEFIETSGWRRQDNLLKE